MQPRKQTLTKNYCESWSQVFIADLALKQSRTELNADSNSRVTLININTNYPKEKDQHASCSTPLVKPLVHCFGYSLST